MKLQTIKKRLKNTFNYDYKDGDNLSGILIDGQVLTFSICDPTAENPKCRGFHVQSVKDKDDPYTDYFGGTFAANFKQAVSWLEVNYR